MQQEIVEGFKLSPQQEQLWLLQCGGQDQPYRAACLVRVEGELDRAALERALRRVADRHEILRTTFRRLSGMSVPVQVIGDAAGVTLGHRDLTALLPEEREELLDAWIETGPPAVDLENGPVLRAELLTFSPGHAVLALALPALCADGETLKNLVSEVARSYAEALGERQGRPGDDPVQYADLAGWQNEILESQDAAARKFWQSRGFLPALSARLPFENAPGESFTPRRVTIPLESRTVRGLQELAARQALPVSDLLLAGWHLLLSRLTGRPDAVIGVACDGRKFEETLGALGPLSRYLPLQCAAGDHATFLDFARTMGSQLSEVRRWQEYFTWQGLSSDEGEAASFFPYGFELFDIPAPKRAAGAAFAIERWSLCTDRFRLKLSGFRRGEDLTTELSFDAAILDPAAAARIGHWLAILLAGAVERPEVAASELRFLSSEEENRLAELNLTASDLGPARTLSELFQEQASRTPERTAVAWGGREITYRELAERSRHLAGFLRSLGVGPEVRVALCVERSLEMVLGLLGILETGGAYVPIDPAYPEDRRRFMREDAQTSVILTQASLAAALGSGREKVVCLDRDVPADLAGESTPARISASPDGLAYVIYTSGSTGRPKGVMVSHRAITNRLLWMQRVFPLSAEDRLLHKTPYSFDASIWEIFLPLISGARLVLAEPGGHQDAAYLVETIERQEITVLQLVPSFLPVFLEQAAGGAPSTLRRLFCGGEALPGELAARAQAQLRVELCNLYGPTEAAIDATFHPCAPAAGEEAVVPIGRPLDNVRIYLLDPRQSLVPPGLPGEIWIGGAGLARGYLDRPELTAERFLPDAWSGMAGERLYRTGDLARLTRGALEFLGRLDNQVKVRGFRIELGEIESALRQHAVVREALVMARELAGEIGAGERRLVAYVVPQSDAGDAEVDEAALRAHLAAQLPEHMVPAAFVHLAALPRLPNGKVDHRALPEPAGAPERREVLASPRTPTEELLTGLWNQLLRNEAIGIHDDFFASGGDSLNATQLISRVRDVFQVDFRVRTLFESPTIAELAERVEAARRGGEETAAPPIRSVPRGGDLPPSFAQQRLWILDRFEPGSPAYNLSLAVRLFGPLDVVALAASLAEIVRRHEVLRTTFAAGESGPVQRIAAFAGLSLPYVDLSALGGRAFAEARRLALVDALRPFDLATGPLFRALLIGLGREEHGVVATMHHIVSDAWSMGLLVDEIGRLYPAFHAGRPPALSELPVQYADYAVWQRDWLTGEILEAEISHWRQRLDGLPSQLELPTDRPRPVVRRAAGSLRWVLVGERLTRSLRALARTEGATLFMVLEAAFEVLLARLSGQESFGVGTPIAGRNRLETERLIGFFVNTLVLRADLAGDLSFRELLGQVRSKTLDAYAHQDLPFEKLVEELSPERSTALTPLFQVMFILQNAAAAEQSLELPGITTAPFQVEDTLAKFDLTLSLAESGDTLPGSLGYSTDLFDGATIERWIGHLDVLLEGIASAPNARLSDLPLLSVAERHQVAEWNRSVDGVFPLDLCLHELFERQAERSPEAVAVMAEGEALSYRELDERANRLSRRLLALGVAAESLVAVCIERTADMVVALLAVLKAGGAYVPMDPEYPAERLEQMLEDSGTAVLVTQRDLLPGRAPGLPRVLLDGERELLERESPQRAHVRVLPQSLAYVIYTSGSTGRPKGVQIPHRAVVNFLGSMQERLALGEWDVLPAVTSLSFDISGLELFLPLATGGRVVVVRREIAQDGARLAAQIGACGATLLQATPATWRLLAEAGWSAPAGLRRLCGGEALPRELAVRLLRDSAPLWNVYGPTETTIWSAARRLEPGEGSVAIGGALARTGLDVRDRHLQPVPIGAPGELYISGEGLARGYLGRPEQTAERFVPAPDGTLPGDRWYRTGDLVRRRGDGTLEFLGRFDHQVKVRGFRIELGEIETVLEGLPEVRQAVVLAVDDPAGGKRLIAYIVLQEPVAVAAMELRRALQSLLPPHMIPAHFLFLEALPLTPNGKVDRRSLPKSEALAAAPRHERGEPSTPVQEMLAEIWAEVLAVPQPGLTDDFFALGGHSLLGTRLMGRIREVFGVDLPLRTLFERPTLAELSERIDSERRAGRSLAAPPLVPVPRGPGAELPLSFAQQRLWFLDRLEPGNPYYNISGAFRLTGRLDAAALAAALRGVVERHEALRANFRDLDGQPIQVVAVEPVFQLPVEDLTALQADQRSALARQRIAEEARRPFDLTADPLFRVLLLRLDEEEHILAFALHHIVGDGWSLGILTRELAAFYAAQSDGDGSRLPPLPVQYADFAAWQKRLLSGETLEGLLDYWRGRLAGAPPVLTLPVDRNRPQRGTFAVASLPIAFRGAAGELRRLGRREGATLFMTLLGALQVLLSRVSGQSEVVVGSPIANRTRPEIEGLIGLFVNTLALRAELGTDPSFQAFLGQVVESSLGAYDHQDLPFERLVEELQPERSLTHAPLFQVLFVLQNAPGAPLALPGLTLEPIGLGRVGSAKLDLTLALSETADGLSGSWEYDPDVFDAATAQRIARCFEVLLESLASGWERPVSELPLLDGAELRQLLVEWNEPRIGMLPAAPIHELFLARAERSPDSMALISGDTRLTYQELAGRVRTWARTLEAMGVGPETLVGIAMERSPEMLTAMLSVLAAGGAYVPLDPEYPRERLAFMLEDSGAALVLTQERLLPRLPATAARVLAVDRDAALLAGTAAPGIPREVDPESAAYVIYTSGSTGTPKGVVIRHGSAASLMAWALATYPREELAGCLAATSVCFDLSVFELFAPLAAGGAVILAMNALALSELPAAGEVTLINTVPSAMAELVRSGAIPASVRVVNLAGEPLRRELVSQILEIPGVGVVYNLYGPSEDTTYSTGARIVSAGGGEPAIGRPLDKGRAYLLDATLQPVPPGVVGEIWLGGAGLARGYLHRPDLTADRFRPNPFSALAGAPGDRLYRTGDLGRLLSDGEIQFLGRRDHQVKIRGFRIELGEVEAALAGLEGVAEAALVVRELAGGPVLVAWVAAAEGASPDPRALREALGDKLPAHMIPAHIVVIDGLPLSPNGKIDRAALASRPLSEEERGAAAAAPRTPTEDLLAGIFAEILQRDAVGTNDDFFALGGHSLLATQVISRVRSVFGAELPLRTLFERPTVAALAVAVDAAAQGSPEMAPPPFTRVPRTDLLPLSFAQQRLWFLHRVEPDSPAYNLPAAVALHGSLSVPALHAALHGVVARHEVLRTTFGSTEVGEPFQRIAASLPVALPWIDLRALPDPRSEALRVLREEAQRPFDLARGPLLRSTLLALEEEEHMVLLTMHHIVSDGWSMGVLIREIAALYSAALRGESSPLPPLPIQYADFAHWQQRWLEGAVLERLVEHWTRSLAGAPLLFELPGARPRPAVQSGRGASRERRIARDLSQELTALSRRESATTFMVLLAAFQVLLHARTGATDLVIGTDVASRNRTEVEPLIGFFINQLVLRTDLGGNPSFREVLGRVREVTLGAYAHQDMPFDRLVDLLKVPRSLASSPLFQVKLVLHNLPETSLELPDLALVPVDAAAETAQLDLNLRAVEGGEGLFLSLQYSTDLYEGPAVERLLEQLEEVLRAVVSHPETRLEELAANVRESDRARWAAREQEGKDARRDKLLAIRRKGSAGEAP